MIDNMYEDNKFCLLSGFNIVILLIFVNIDSRNVLVPDWQQTFYLIHVDLRWLEDMGPHRVPRRNDLSQISQHLLPLE